MLRNDLIGFGLFIGYFVAAGLPPMLLKAYHKTSFEMTRKMYHLVITLSIFPLLNLFGTWYMAVLAALAFGLMIYPVLTLVECSSFYKRVAVERDCGEFKRSFIIVQLSIITLISVTWGLFGDGWRYIAVVAVMAWGFGDAAAALVGKAIGRNRILHPRIEGAKTFEGTLAMYIVAGLAIFLTLLMYAGQSWQVSIAVAMLVAPASATVELFSNRGMDTLTVPLSVAFLVMPLVSLFTFLGI